MRHTVRSAPAWPLPSWLPQASGRLRKKWKRPRPQEREIKSTTYLLEHRLRPLAAKGEWAHAGGACDCLPPLPLLLPPGIWVVRVLERLQRPVAKRRCAAWGVRGPWGGQVPAHPRPGALCTQRAQRGPLGA